MKSSRTVRLKHTERPSEFNLYRPDQPGFRPSHHACAELCDSDVSHAVRPLRGKQPLFNRTKRWLPICRPCTPAEPSVSLSFCWTKPIRLLMLFVAKVGWTSDAKPFIASGPGLYFACEHIQAMHPIGAIWFPAEEQEVA
eukprot:scaffold117607_cov23-Prasinocladus_malaysianus.AAC.2